MSLILEALNKADKERDAQPAIPDLKSVHEVPKTVGGEQKIIYIIAGLLVLILLVLIVVLLRGIGGEPVSSNQSASVGTVMSIASPHSLSEVENIAVSAASLEVPREEGFKQNTAVDSMLSTERSLVTASQALPKVPRSSVEVDSEIAAIYAESAALEKAKQENRRKRLKEIEKQTETAKPSIKDTPVSNDALFEAVWEEVKKDLPGNYEADIQKFNRENNGLPSGGKHTVSFYKDVPYIHELPPNFQHKIPSIMYSNHIYSNKGSAVILNGKPLKKGERFEGDITVQQILSDGVILNFQNKLFKLSELSSWVNMN